MSFLDVLLEDCQLTCTLIGGMQTYLALHVSLECQIPDFSSIWIQRMLIIILKCIGFSILKTALLESMHFAFQKTTMYELKKKKKTSLTFSSILLGFGKMLFCRTYSTLDCYPIVSIATKIWLLAIVQCFGFFGCRSSQSIRRSRIKDYSSHIFEISSSTWNFLWFLYTSLWSLLGMERMSNTSHQTSFTIASTSNLVFWRSKIVYWWSTIQLHHLLFLKMICCFFLVSIAFFFVKQEQYSK